jgi:hypothetical protein
MFKQETQSFSQEFKLRAVWRMGLARTSGRQPATTTSV